jgi:hypothetical protein
MGNPRPRTASSCARRADAMGAARALLTLPCSLLTGANSNERALVMLGSGKAATNERALVMQQSGCKTRSMPKVGHSHVRGGWRSELRCCSVVLERDKAMASQTYLWKPF